MQREPGAGTFVLGLGAQKSGTTWLWHHLCRAEGFVPGFHKEYHVFDVLDVPAERSTRRGMAARAAAALEAFPRSVHGGADMLHRAAMLADTTRYYDYFESLLVRDRAAVATGDLTPSYGMLGPDRLTTVRSEFDRRGLRTVAVFLMRDPVERIWSQARMRRQGGEAGGAVGSRAVARLHASGGFERRSRYDLTLEALDQAFPESERFVGFYETLFDSSTTDAIADLVGLPHVEPLVRERSNATVRDLDELPRETVEQVARHYADVYRAVARRFPDVDLRELWPSASFVL